MTKKCLYLVSSSASREYVVDCVEALALPRGMILHFRYRHKYIDENLRDSLPNEGGRLPSSLHNLSVVVVYLYQVQKVGVWNPGDTMGPGGPYLPLRCGRLVNAFKDGEIAHFFFELTGYVKLSYRRSSSRRLLNDEITFRAARRKDATISYAHVSRDLDLDSGSAADTMGFQSIVDDAYLPTEWRTRSLGSMPLDVTYEIVFLRVSGLFRERTGQLTRIMPVHKSVGGNVMAQYVLEAGQTYHMRLVTHLSARIPAALPGHGLARLRLLFDSDVLRPLGPTSLRISSLYELEYWSFVADAKENRSSMLTIACEHDMVIDHKEFVRSELLCPEISLPITIVPAKTAKKAGGQ